MSGTEVTPEFLAKLQARIDSGIPAVADLHLLRDAVEYIAVIDGGFERSMEITEKVSAVVQQQGALIERMRTALDRIAFCGAGEDYRVLREIARTALTS